MSTLRPEHLISQEDRLVNFLRPLLSFSTASLYFPPPSGPLDSNRPSDDQAVLDRDILLIPLIHTGRRLGMLRLSGVEVNKAQPMLPVLPHLLSSCLQIMDLELQLSCDPLTGMLRQETFLQRMSQKIRQLADFLQPGLGSVEDPGRRPDFALLMMDISHMSALNRQAGHRFGDRILQGTAQVLQEAAGPHSLVSRIQGDSFALLLPGIAPQRIASQARQISQAVRELRFTHPVSQAPIKLEISMGGVNFPQDLRGTSLQIEAEEQGKHLLDLAQEGQKRALSLGRQEVVTQAEILKSCGRIKDVVSSSRVRIDLGSEQQARKGLHFQLQPRRGEDNEHIKAELRLIQVESTNSLAELLLPSAWDGTVQPGDRVELIENPSSYILQFGTDESQPDPTGPFQVIPEPKDFFPRWATVRRQAFRFTLSLISAPPSSLGDVIHTMQARTHNMPSSSLIARYGLGSLLVYIPDHSPQETEDDLRAVLASLPDEVHPDTAVGIGYYPCLDLTRSETLDMAKQALEHARLLPPPGLARFDSTTLTLHGDRAFSRNELRQAMHAYSQALLLNQANSLARNSLAICLARVGEFSAACAEFRHILNLDPDNYMAEYNYGYVCLKLQEREQAKACFQRCLELMPGHSFSLLRLGQMAEEDADLEQATAYCRQAAQSAPDQGAPYRVLGRLAWKTGDRDQARRYLHQALVAAPQDPDALRLLARLTLEQGDDPEVAESFIRRSLGIQPGNPESHELLDWALRAQGKE